MKRIIAAMLAVTLVLALAGCKAKNNASESGSSSTAAASGSAASGSDSANTSSVGTTSSQEFVIGGSDTTAQNGQNFSIPVTVTENSYIAAADIVVSYDTSKLTYVSCTDSGSGFILTDNEVSPGSIKIGAVTLNPPTEASTIFTLNFKANEGASGDSTVEISYESCYDDTCVNVLTPETQSPVVTIR